MLSETGVDKGSAANRELPALGNEIVDDRDSEDADHIRCQDMPDDLWHVVFHRGWGSLSPYLSMDLLLPVLRRAIYYSRGPPQNLLTVIWDIVNNLSRNTLRKFEADH